MVGPLGESVTANARAVARRGDWCAAQLRSSAQVLVAKGLWSPLSWPAWASRVRRAANTASSGSCRSRRTRGSRRRRTGTSTRRCARARAHLAVQVFPTLCPTLTFWANGSFDKKRVRKEDTTSRQQANGIETAGSGKDLGSGFGPWLIKPAAASSNLRLTYSYPGRFTRVYNKPYT